MCGHVCDGCVAVGVCERGFRGVGIVGMWGCVGVCLDVLNWPIQLGKLLI